MMELGGCVHHDTHLGGQAGHDRVIFFLTQVVWRGKDTNKEDSERGERVIFLQ